MNENEIIQKIVKQRKQRVSELGLQEDFDYLIFKENLLYWFNWQNDEDWKTQFLSNCNIQSITSLSDEELKKNKLEYSIKIIFLNKEEYKFDVEEWSSGIDSSSKYSKLHFFVNNDELIQFDLIYCISEYSQKYVSDVISFKDTDWLVNFKEFVKNIKQSSKNYSNFLHEENLKNESNQLKEKYNISDEEIKKFSSNEETEHQSNLSTYDVGKFVGKFIKKVLK